MADEQWKKQDFQALWRREISAGIDKPDAFPQHLLDFFQQASAHYESASEDGKAFVDQATDKLSAFFEEKIKETPDTAEKRRMLRALAGIQGKHFQAKDLFDSLYRPTESDELLSDATLVLVRTVQSLMDILHDVIREPDRGAAQFSILGLFFWLIDEITVVQFLARQEYATLAYTHLRSTMEIIDKIQLFTEKPETADIWQSGDERQIWKKLSPARVREKLGKSSFDPMYQYLSEQGSHSTFTAMQTRLRKQSESAGQGIRIALIIGGIHDKARQLSILTYAVLLTNLAMTRAVKAFGERLNFEDITQLVVASTDECFAFFEKLFAYLEGQQIDTRPFDTLRREWERTRHTADPLAQQQGRQ